MRLALAAASVILIAGCAPQTGPGNGSTDLNAAAESAQADVNSYAEGVPRPAAKPLAPAEPGQPGEPTPQSEPELAPGSAQSADYVVQKYYALIRDKKYVEARALWSDGGKASAKPQADFAAGLAAFRDFQLKVGAPGPIDAGAGQRYITLPVQISARRGNGSVADWLGTVVLHRTADIDGASAEQKAWRIQSIDLKSAPGKAADAGAGTPPAAARYRCMDGTKIAVRFDRAANTAAIVRNGRPLATLDAQPAASGMRYVKGGYKLRGQGDAATLTTPGQPPIACTAIR